MERDMELVRKLLKDYSEGKSKLSFQTEINEDKKIIYHMKIMKDHGLICYKRIPNKDLFGLEGVPELTWEGHDFLSSIENDSVWMKTKETIKSKGIELGAVSFDVLTELAKMKLREKMGLQ